jgi:glycosyltransferase involved in cell wall biosynthesis
MVKRILWIGDAVAPTGFSTVNHNIIKNLDKEKYQVHHIGINYYGDPHTFEHFIYPALTPRGMQTGDVYGYSRIDEFVRLQPHIIFILNDIWVVKNYLKIIKEKFVDNMPHVVVYFPVDGAGYNPEWFEDFDIVSKAVVYTEFGKRVVLDAYPDIKDRLQVIPHGTDTSVFYPVEDKKALRQKSYPNLPELLEDDAFIVLNANRNQPRKRLDLSLRAFAMFAAKKPTNVRYYQHAGLKDAGWDTLRLVKQIDYEFFKRGILSPGDFKLEDRLIVTNLEPGTQKVGIDKLNNIYNVTDVGINTALGEGWGLTATEHAATGAVQIVPNHTACAELFKDCGLLINVKTVVNDTQTLLTRGFIDVVHLAKLLEKLYQDKELRETLAFKGYTKFTSKKYQWEHIAKKWETLFNELPEKELGEQVND